MSASFPRALGAIALSALAGVTLHAQGFTWTPVVAGSGYNWNDAPNWTPNTSFPNAAGDVANLNNDIGGDQTIRLRQNLTLGTLSLGDANASVTASTFTIANA